MIVCRDKRKERTGGSQYSDKNQRINLYKSEILFNEEIKINKK